MRIQTLQPVVQQKWSRPHLRNHQRRIGAEADRVRQRTSPSNNYNRNSNIELLRIFCIFLITVHHFITHGGGQTPDIQSVAKVYPICHSMLYIGVDCFLLISGYFGIKFRIKNFVNLYATYLLYSILICGLSARNFLPFSHSGLWFVECYVGLMLFSPILEAAIEKYGRKQFLILIVFLTVFNLYFGYFWKVEYYNVTGFNIWNFIYLYFLAAYIRKFVSVDTLRGKRLLIASVYVLSAVIHGLLSYIQSKGTIIPHWDMWKYNNPILIIESIAFFMFFLSFDIKSKIINWLASGVFAVYVSQMIFGDNLWNFVETICNTKIWGYLLLALGYVFVILFIDKTRQLILKPILSTKWMNKKLC